MWPLFSPSLTDIGKAALLYTGLSVLTDVAGAVGRGAVAAIDSVLPSSGAEKTYNNPAHLGQKIDTKA